MNADTFVSSTSTRESVLATTSIPNPSVLATGSGTSTTLVSAIASTTRISAPSRPPVTLPDDGLNSQYTWQQNDCLKNQDIYYQGCWETLNLDNWLLACSGIQLSAHHLTKTIVTFGTATAPRKHGHRPSSVKPKREEIRIVQSLMEVVAALATMSLKPATLRPLPQRC